MLEFIFLMGYNFSKLFIDLICMRYKQIYLVGLLIPIAIGRQPTSLTFYFKIEPSIRLAPLSLR